MELSYIFQRFFGDGEAVLAAHLITTWKPFGEAALAVNLIFAESVCFQCFSQIFDVNIIHLSVSLCQICVKKEDYTALYVFLDYSNCLTCDAIKHACQELRDA